MKIILIGNYQPDKQESMIRFAQMLSRGFQEANIISEIWWPTVFFGAVATTTSNGWGKWLGYLDKWLLFPLVLRWRLRSKTLSQTNVRFHVCDHSNAPYLKYLPTDRTAITCHDVLAIRGGLGHADAYAPASYLGKVLQTWIFYHLSRAKLIATVSQLTLRQLQELTTKQTSSQQDWRVIHNAFNADFRPMKAEERNFRLNQVGLVAEEPFLLHVGSGHLRKNRRLLLSMAAALGTSWKGCICFAGEVADEPLLAYAQLLGLQDRVVSVVKPNHTTLTALYSACVAFVFPSFSEGFGWPLIEAQACGAPVITSNIPPMPEVSGGAALYADPTRPQDFADAFLILQNKATRANLIQQGYENSRRFELRRMIQAYLHLHGL